MTSPAFFGYGSLVNRATHAHAPAHPARLAGWRRVWLRAPVRPVAFLSVRPAPGAEIAGLVAEVPGGDWAALDLRETGYARHDVTAFVRHAAPGPLAVQVYAVAGDPAPADAAHPVLLSYLDTVAQGFLREWGAAGLAAFFATTDGWEAPVLDDRAAPRYPRAQPVTEAERAAVDAHLSALRVRMLRG